MQIYIHRDNKQLGPFTEAELKMLLKTGVVSLKDYAWWEGQSQWTPLNIGPLAETLILGTVDLPGLSSTSTHQGTSQFAIFSLICGCLSLLCGILALPAVVFGHLSLSEIKRHPGLKGHGMALAGLVLGYVIIVLMLMAILVFASLGDQMKGSFKSIKAQMESVQTPSSSDDNDSSTNSAEDSNPPSSSTDSSNSSTNSTPTTTP